MPSPATRVASAAGSLRAYLRDCISVDTRALAIFRVSLAVLILADLLLRSRNFHFFYTEYGVVPRSLARDLSADYAFSVYHLTTNTTVIAALFVLQAVIALQLLVGYRTRLATVLSFLLVVSLDHHNPLVLSYADTLFRLLLFWAIFVPLGERWSIDAVHRERASRATVASVATLLLLGQMVFMYVSNGAIKSVSDTWRGGEAAPLVLGLDEMTFLLGDTVREFPTLLSYGGTLWYLMMVFGWLLLVTRGWPRMALLTLYIGGHLSFALTVRIGAFAYVALAGLTVFVQRPVWDRCWRLLESTFADPVATAADRLTALAERVPNPRWGGERARQFRRGTYAATMAIIVVTILFVATAIAVQAGATASGHDGDVPIEVALDQSIEETLEETAGVREVDTVASSLGIDQPIGWGVFAPEPRTVDRYYVFPAVTEHGEYVDAFSDRELTYDRPHDELQTQHGTYRERFYMNSVRRGSHFNDVAPTLAEYHCERWEREYGESLEQLEMYEVTEQVTHETITDPTDRERSYNHVYRHSCSGGPMQTIPGPASSD